DEDHRPVGRKPRGKAGDGKGFVAVRYAVDQHGAGKVGALADWLDEFRHGDRVQLALTLLKSQILANSSVLWSAGTSSAPVIQLSSVPSVTYRSAYKVTSYASVCFAQSCVAEH